MMTNRIGAAYISVDRDKLTGGIQISIGDDSGGYRIAGPKYCGSGESLKRHVLTKRDADEIRHYLDRIDDEAKMGSAGNARALGDESI